MAYSYADCPTLSILHEIVIEIDKLCLHFGTRTGKNFTVYTEL
jgi:hypothetical protein